MEVTEEQQWRQVEEQVERLLSGQGSEVSGCDVGLEQSKPAALRKTVTYIVCGVIFNEKRHHRRLQPPGPELVNGSGSDQNPGRLSDPQLLSVADHSLPSCHDLVSLVSVKISAGYRQDPWHPVSLPLDLSCRHVVQRLVLVFTGAEQQVWVLLIKAPVLHLPTAAAVKTHAVTWAANMVVQEAMPSTYYDHNVNTVGVFSLQHNGRQHGKTDGVCFNALVALVPDHVQRNEDGEKVEVAGTGRPPPVENPRYVWHEVQKQTLREKLLEKTKNMSILPIHSLY
ncbi:8-oxo-dGDP phosphatase NUDT18 [Collichthys lucidus]|uniref:8-oxo-dGDP phosphatase NUDT18 n=1 Tax=Collichthys lucidus TaxID=240159 RepID=A0A4U5UVC2_COLLU|nr:8-oxo-dGDP phosphatase NUDT18 [Collichthys lucidus]